MFAEAIFTISCEKKLLVRLNMICCTIVNYGKFLILYKHLFDILRSDKVDTKQKILVTARKLFAQKGFSGTSVRDISRDADVNVAAINYHFQGKRQLLLSMLDRDKEIIINQVEALTQSSSNYMDFIIGLFDCFCINPETISTYYKISMTSDEFGEDVLAGYCEFRAKILEYIGKSLTASCSKDFCRNEKDWVSNTILNQLVFDATSLSVPAIQNAEYDWMLGIDQRRNRMKKLAAILRDALCEGKVGNNL